MVIEEGFFIMGIFFCEIFHQNTVRIFKMTGSAAHFGMFS